MNNTSSQPFPPETTPATPFISRRQLIVLLALLLALRIGYSLTMRFDNDEPQHLHVVWAWAQGKLPYKDLFDNHAPLFQWLSAPLLRLIGERPNIVIPMRWSCIPLFFLSLYLVYRAGRAVLPASLAFWAAVFGCLLPRGFLKSVEYRPDDLWAALWFAFLAVLVTGRSHPKRAFAAGVIMGISFSVTMKSTLMVLATIASFLVLFLLRFFQGKQRINLVAWMKMGAAALGGVVILPALIALYFYAQGALLPSQSPYANLWYNVIEHNIVPGMKRSEHPHYLDPGIVILFCFLIVGAVLIYRQDEPPAIRHRRVFLFLAPGFYLFFLYGFWPDLTREDDPPFYPLVGTALFILGSAYVPVRWKTLSPRLRLILPWATVACLLAWLMVTQQPWDKRNRRQVSTMTIVLKLAAPNDYVMDAKSGSVFRQRPFYFVTETITRARMRRNLIRDDIAKCLIETKTTVADFRGYQHGTKGEGFIFANYLPLKENDSVGVVGKRINANPVAAGETIQFKTLIAARYAVIDEYGRVAGILDGTALDQSRDLAPGEHSFSPSAPCAKLMLVLAKALDLGYHPTVQSAHRMKTISGERTDS